MKPNPEKSSDDQKIREPKQGKDSLGAGSSGGIELTDATLNSLADAAERGYNVDHLRVAQPGRAQSQMDSEAGRFKSSPADQLHRRWAFHWAEELECETGVYNRRWRAETPWFSIRLHHWMHSDDSRHVHDHPWNFYTFILKGSYVDVSPGKYERVRTGHLYYRAAEHQHWVKLDRGDCWTIIFTGPKVRSWGFWRNGTFIRSFRYFYRFGRHPCD